MPASTRILTISDEDLLAYAEHRLDPVRHAEVEGFLACNPDLAARVMQMRHQRGRQRAAIAAAPQRTGFIARNRGMLTACLACVIAGWAMAEGMDEEGPFEGLLAAPEYVEDAVMAQQVTDVRRAIGPVAQRPWFDTAGVLRAMQLRLPQMPVQWRLVDVQLYPSEEGPSISLLFETEAGREVNLFAVRANTAAHSRPALAMRAGRHAAYWEREGTAYVLSGDAAAAQILAQATQLSQAALN